MCNTHTQTHTHADDKAFARELDEVDACGGLAMTIRRICDAGQCLFETDHHGQYHYRTLPSCLVCVCVWVWVWVWVWV